MEVFKYFEEKLFVLPNNGEPLFRAHNVSSILNYKNTKKAIRDHVDEEDIFIWEDILNKIKQNIDFTTTIKNLHPKTKFINESGVYSLILRSNLPKAKKFKRWVTKELLPTIRKTGQYKIESQARLNLLEKGGELLKSFGNGVLEERDSVLLKSEIRNILFADKLLINNEKRLEVPITDRIVMLGFRYTSKDKTKLMMIGKEIKKAYVAKHKTEPIKREQFMSTGETRKVNVYTEDDFELMDPIIKKYYKPCDSSSDSDF